MFSRGSSRLARDAAVRPAALPPTMSILSMRLKVLLSCLDPRIWIALAHALDHEVVVAGRTDTYTLKAGCLYQFPDFCARERCPHGGFNVWPHTIPVTFRMSSDFSAHVESAGPPEITDQMRALWFEDSIDFSE